MAYFRILLRGGDGGGGVCVCVWGGGGGGGNESKGGSEMNPAVTNNFTITRIYNFP